MITSPTIVSDGSNHARADGISIDITLASEFVFIFIDYSTAVAALEEMPFAAVAFIVFESKTPIDVVEEFGEINGIQGVNDKMTVITHPLVADQFNMRIFCKINAGPFSPKPVNGGFVE